MNLNRFQRIVKARWWVLAVVALVSLWIAGNLTELRNLQRPDREALASVTFFRRIDDLTGDLVEARVADAESLALEINAGLLSDRVDPLAPWPIAEIRSDPVNHQLLFIGRGDTDEEASQIALLLRENFLETQPFEDPAEIQSRLSALGQRLGELNAGIEQLTALPPPDPNETVRVALLQTEISALKTRYASLVIELLAPEDRTAEEILEEMELLRTELVARQGQAPVEEGPAPRPNLELVVLELQYGQLQGVYEQLFLQQVEAESVARVDPSVNTYASTLQPVPPIANQALGLLAGLLVGVVGLVVADRMRGPVWSTAELEGMATLLPEMPPRGLRVPSDRPWYLAAPAGLRKAGLQMVRATVEGLWTRGAAALGITGIGAHIEDVQELAADLATSVAISGHSVLLVDAGLDRPSSLLEFGSGRVVLTHLLRIPVDDAEAVRATMKELLVQTHEVIPNLRALPAGIGAVDPADILAGPQLALILDAARELFDAVIIAGADADHPITHVLSQRLDAMVLLGSAGRTTSAAVEVELRELANRRAQVLGLVLLTKSPSPLRRALGRLISGRAERRVGRQRRREPEQERRPELAGARSHRGAGPGE